MPTTYAHYTFGKEVLKELKEDDLKQIINKNIDLYNIGLHGPDILFYYNPLKSNIINKRGNAIHSENFDIFLENARNVIHKSNDNERAISYIMGFICHFMLDSECHPYIGEKQNKELSHNEIESEFDRIFMVNNNLNPILFKPTEHILPRKEYAHYISSFYDIDSDTILKALKSMKFYLNFLVSPRRLKRFIILKGLKFTGNYNSMKGLIMNYEPNPSCIEINENLHKLYMDAIIPTANMLYDFYDGINDEKPLNKRFYRNFG